MWICMRAIVPLQTHPQRNSPRFSEFTLGIYKVILIFVKAEMVQVVEIYPCRREWHNSIHIQTNKGNSVFYLFHVNWQIERGPYYWCTILWNGCHGSAIGIDNAMSQWLLVSYTPNLGALLTLSLTCAFYTCCTHISKSVETRTGVWDNGQTYATFDEIVTIFSFSCVYFHFQ